MLTIDLTPFPVIETDRLILRRITKEDAPEIFRMRSDTDVMRYIDRPLHKSVTESEEFVDKVDHMISNNDGINWGIQLKSDPKLIGMISYHRIAKEHFRAEVGYMLHSDFHRKGIMQEAITAVLSHGFDQFHFHSIEALVNPENIASIALLEKNGFIREAYFRENYYWDGKFLDTSVYSLLKK